MLAKTYRLVGVIAILLVRCAPALSEQEVLEAVAGEYFEDSFFTTYALSISPDGSFKITSEYDTGGRDTQTGTFRVDDATLLLQYDDEPLESINKLIPVVWGDRKYLFNMNSEYENIVELFCHNVAVGSETRKEDDQTTLFIFLHKQNHNAAIADEPNFLNGTPFCPSQ